MLRTDAITKCRVIQKIEKTLNNSTHTTTQKRTDRHNLREVNYKSSATRHLDISHNTPCLRWRFLELSLFILIAENCQSGNLL